MICIPEPHKGDCEGCPAIYEVPSGYFSGMDLATCPKTKTCPCGFEPLHGGRCVRIKSVPIEQYVCTGEGYDPEDKYCQSCYARNNCPVEKDTNIEEAAKSEREQVLKEVMDAISLGTSCEDCAARVQSLCSQQNNTSSRKG